MNDEIRAAAERLLSAMDQYDGLATDERFSVQTDTLTVARAVLAADDERERLVAALQNITDNVRGLGEGKMPAINEHARFYFRIIARIGDAALSALPSGGGGVRDDERERLVAALTKIQNDIVWCLEHKPQQCVHVRDALKIVVAALSAPPSRRGGAGAPTGS